MLLMKGSGNPNKVPRVIIKAHRGKALELSKPPIREKVRPPRITPETGPVIAAIAK